MINIPGKDTIFCDEDGNYSLYSSEEILTKRLNNWKGWKCSAGVSTIHITSDGNIFSGTCKVGGLLGNVFDADVEFPQEWQTCTKEWCMCGSEMKNLKVPATQADVTKLSKPLVFTEDEITPQWVGIAYSKLTSVFPKTVTWDLGRRCNYSCSYCPPSTANNYEAHKSFESLKTAINSLLFKFSTIQRVKWIFTGGEPTLNPAFMEILKYLNQFRHIAHTQTNGSRDPNYYSELIEYSSIGFSIHFEEFNEKKFLSNCEAILKKKSIHAGASVNWVGVRLMVPPGSFQKALVLKEKLLNLPPLWGKLDFVNMSPLYEKEDGDKLMDYSTYELNDINAHL